MQLHIINYGAKVRVKNGLFVVRYFDQKEQLQKEEFSPALVESIWLNNTTTLSVAVLELAMKNNVDIVFTDKYHFPIGRFNTHKPHSTSKIQKAQAIVSISPQALYFIKKWGLRKLNAQINLLEKLANRRKGETKALLDRQSSQIRPLLSNLEKLEAPLSEELKQKIRGNEGAGSRAFFYALNSVLKPRYQFERRSRRPPKDAFNAFLNYAFALLYAKIERALTLAGVNPYIGFLHRDGYQFKSMVYDFIEPYRMDTTWVVFQLFSREKVILSKHIEARDNGIFLNRAGKQLLIEAEKKYFEKRTDWNGILLRRVTIMEREAQLFAKELMAIANEIKTLPVFH